jgi:hypothetical protein
MRWPLHSFRLMQRAVIEYHKMARSRTGASKAVHPALGRVSEVNFGGSPDQPKLIPIDEQPDDEVRHLNRLGKTDCLTGQSLDSGSQPQVCTFNLLRVAFARLVRRRLEMTRVGPLIIRVITLDPKWL